MVSWGILGLFVDAVGGANIVADGPCLVELTPATDAAPAVWERPKPSVLREPSGTYAWSESNPSSVPATRQPLRPTRAPALDAGTKPPAAPSMMPDG